MTQRTKRVPTMTQSFNRLFTVSLAIILGVGCDSGDDESLRADSFLLVDNADGSNGDTLTFDLSEPTTGLLLGTLSVDDVELITIATLRGPMVDRERLEQPLEVPDYLVDVRMTLPSGQVIYQNTQADLPTKTPRQDTWVLPESTFNGGVEEADPTLIALAAQHMADALDDGRFDAERVVLLRIAESVESSAFQPEPLVQPPLAELLSCFGAACEGKDPHEYHCEDDAINAAFYEVTWLYSRHLFLRYSDDCRTNWGKFSSNSTESSTVYVQRWSPSKTYSSYHTGTLNYSDMVHCPDESCLARARVTWKGTTYSTGYY